MYILNLYHKVVKINGCLDGYLDDAVCVLQERKRVKFANKENVENRKMENCVLKCLILDQVCFLAT